VNGLGNIGYLDLVRLTPLLERTRGRPEIKIGLIDGPVVLKHPDLATENIREVPGEFAGACALSSSAACKHGTFVAGMLLAKRASAAPAICPGCSLLVRPIFRETSSTNGQMSNATPQQLASAIAETVDAGAQILNLSASLVQPSAKGEGALRSALDYAAQRAVIVVAAAGNQGLVGSSVITRHPWVIPVAGCDLKGRPISQSNLGNSIGMRGVLSPGDNVTSLGSGGELVTFSGTSVAAPLCNWNRGSAPVRVPNCVRDRAVVGGARDAKAEPHCDCTTSARRLVDSPVHAKQRIQRRTED
jgi:subtilisin family serine protease